MRRSVFVLYHGDEVVDLGTAEEIAERRGIKPETLRWYATRSARDRHSHGMIAVRVEVDADWR